MGDRNDLIGGILVGKYQLKAHLGPGRFGDFWRATRLKDNRDVAVKLLKPELFTDPQASVRFERETRLLLKFQHPNLLRVLEGGRTETGTPYVVTEYREGRLLSEDVADLALSVDKVCHVAMQMAAVLASAHSRGIVHRGLNPDAIFLCDEYGDPNRVKLLDFGLAHLTAASGEVALTRVGQRLGSPEYLAPEYIEDQHLDARSDVYVLGVIVFEMLTGQPPFVGRAQSVLQKHVEDDPWPPSEMCEQEVPPWLDALVLAMLAKRPEDRPQTGLVVARAFTYRKYPP